MAETETTTRRPLQIVFRAEEVEEIDRHLERTTPPGRRASRAGWIREAALERVRREREQAAKG